ncbi:MAG: CHAD domain-containing protein [Thermaurantiacus sp.]
MSGSRSSTEIELKAAVPARERARLARALDARCGSQGRKDRLRTIYFDTADQRLAQAGVAFRMRRSAAGWRLTVKADRSTSGGVQRAREVEATVRGPQPDPGRIPDRAMRERLRTLLGDDALRPVFETRVTRTTWRLTGAHGVTEVALDLGTIQSDGRRKPISEVEIELVAGAPDELFRVAEDLLGNRPADLSIPSKADRGIALATQDESIDAPPLLPPPDQLQPAEAEFSALLGALAAQISRRLFETFTADDPQGPHQLRVALRRLRAALWLYRPILDRGVAAQIAADARQLGRMVSPLRDADVLVGDLLLPSVSGEDAPLAEALTDWHRRVRSRVRGNLRRARATGFVIRLNRLVAIGDWRRRGRRAARIGQGLPHDVVRPRLDRLWERQRDVGDRLAGLGAEARHAFRKQMKKLRYAIEFGVPADERKPFLQACKRLQESLGELNDQVALQSFAPALPSPELAARLQARMDALRGGQRVGDLALGRACRQWQALGRLSPPWRDESSGPPKRRAARHP